MYSGKLGIAYDFDIILNAAQKLSSIEPIKFVIRGFGEQENYISRKISELKLTNIVLDTSFVDKKCLCELLNSADVFILPMKPITAAEQGLPTKILEYQACGKPIICSSQGESSVYINFTKSGLVVKPEDSDALASSILKLYRNKSLRYELGRNGCKNVIQNQSLLKIGERMYNVFSKLKPGSV